MPLNRLALAAALVAAGAAGLAAFVLQPPRLPERQIVTRPNQVVENGYTTSNTCRSCHPSQYQSWHDSFHRTMTQVASPAAIVAPFSGEVSEVTGRPMTLSRSGDEFSAEFDDPDWNGRGSPTRINRRVVMTTGSHQQQVYWYQTDDRQQLGQLPGTYLIKERRWVPREAVFLMPPTGRPESATGRWDNTCIHCHSTHGTSPQPGDDARPRSKVVEFGIACEACHGPSASHGQVNWNPIRRYASHLTGRADPTTVQPVRLDPKASAQVCGQCHGVWFYDDRTKGTPASLATLIYRPGDDISKTRFLVRPSVDRDSPTMAAIHARFPDYNRNLFWSDGMMRVSGREYNGLVDSPCFDKATDPQRTLTCASCHTLHKPAGDTRTIGEWADSHQVTSGKEGNAACVGCHQTVADNLTTHTRHRADSPGSSCYNCHMPYTSYGLLRAQRSHQISSPNVRASVDTGRPNACNACHLDKSLAWAARSLQNWYGQEPPPLDDDQQNVAASLLWLLRGDAGQRALMTWAMGWKPAQQVSGNDWMAGYLAGVLDDDYAAVRLIAYRSLRSLPGYETEMDHAVAPRAQRSADLLRVMNTFGKRTAKRTDPQLLFNRDGSFQVNLIQRLVAQRDNRPVFLNE